MGAIMAVGVATANSILMVTFANDQRTRTATPPIEAALAAGRTRLRPVIMTALAMIVGMLPMCLGLGEGGEQNAPLGRAVIGGLAVATVATLFFVPVVYTLLRRKLPHPKEDPELQEIPDYGGQTLSPVLGGEGRVRGGASSCASRARRVAWAPRPSLMQTKTWASCRSQE